MKKTLTTGLVLASIAFGVLAVSACAAPTSEEETDIRESSALSGPGVWQLQRECGTKETGACAKNIVACDGVIGDACGAAGSRCLTAPTQSGLRQVLLCNPTSNSTWTYNGDCATAGCPGRPACDVSASAGTRCHYPLRRCAKGGRVLVCLTDGKDQYVFSGYCGKNGGPACADYAACPRDEDGMAGLACDALGTTCQYKLDKLTGKVFTCVSR